MAYDAISLESGIRFNLISLQKTTQQLSRTEERLSTGKKVNAAIDNPTNYFAARGLNNRADGLNERLDGMGQAVQQIQAANLGIDAVRDLIANMKAVVNDALTKSDASARRALGEQYNMLIEQAALIPQDSGYQGVNLLADNQTLQIQFNELHGTSTLNVGGMNLVGGGEAGASEVTGITKIEAKASQASAGAVASVSSRAAVAARSSVASAGSAAAETSVASEASVTSVASQASAGSVGGIPSAASHGSVASVASEASIASRASVASSASAGTVASLAAQMSYASRASAASTASVGAIASTFVSQQYAFTMNVSAADKGTEEVVGLKKAEYMPYGPNSRGYHSVDFGSVDYLGQLNELLVDIEKFDDALETQASRLSNALNVVTIRENFTEDMIDTLQEGADKLVLADMNEEGANLLALQTRHSLGIQSLALASQQSQQVLRLLG